MEITYEDLIKNSILSYNGSSDYTLLNLNFMLNKDIVEKYGKAKLYSIFDKVMNMWFMYLGLNDLDPNIIRLNGTFLAFVQNILAEIIYENEENKNIILHYIEYSKDLSNISVRDMNSII